MRIGKNNKTKRGKKYSTHLTLLSLTTSFGKMLVTGQIRPSGGQRCDVETPTEGGGGAGC